MSEPIHLAVLSTNVPEKPLDTYRGFGGPAWMCTLGTAMRCWYHKGEHAHLRGTPALPAALLLPQSPGSLLLPSLAVFLCPRHARGTRLRLQGQGKGTDIQLGTATPASPSSHHSSPGSQACPGWSMPPSPSEKAKVLFLEKNK